METDVRPRGGGATQAGHRGGHGRPSPLQRRSNWRGLGRSTPKRGRSHEERAPHESRSPVPQRETRGYSAHAYRRRREQQNGRRSRSSDVPWGEGGVVAAHKPKELVRQTQDSRRARWTGREGMIWLDQRWRWPGGSPFPWGLAALIPTLRDR